MTVQVTTNAYHDASGSWTHKEIFIGRVVAPGCISKIDVQGFIFEATQTVGLSAGVYGLYNVVAGVQYGPQGYSAVPITTGTSAGANWISYGNLLQPVDGSFLIAGSTPLNAVNVPAQPINLAHRQSWYCAANTDVYLCIGSDNSFGGPPQFNASVKMNMEYGQYP